MNRVIDDLIASAKSLADKAGKATDKAVEYSKLKYQSVQLAGELRDLYGKLGNAVYTMVKSDFDNKDLMDSIISEIDHVKETLEQLEGKLAEFRNSVICPACAQVFVSNVNNHGFFSRFTVLHFAVFQYVRDPQAMFSLVNNHILYIFLCFRC